MYLTKDGTQQSATSITIRPSTSEEQLGDVHRQLVIGTEVFRGDFVQCLTTRQMGEVSLIDFKPPEVDGRTGVQSISSTWTSHVEPVTFVKVTMPVLPCRLTRATALSVCPRAHSQHWWFHHVPAERWAQATPDSGIHCLWRAAHRK